ncbi:hypothetical protein B9Z55_007755 [Caenorhabditis nigoni]|nr:hypothetical protein B9Z55_007755 [Caenorhabditis nigoni]
MEHRSEKEFVLKHVFENVANLKINETVTSKDVEHINANWHMEVKRFGTHLGFYFYCKPIAPVGDKWSIETNIKFIIMDNDGNIAIKAMKNRFKERDDYGYEEFLWEDVEYYLANNNLTIQVEVEILKMTGFGKENIREFDESQKDVSDVILAVQDTKFYVQKMYLALHSSYFKAIFFGKFNESEKSEIELKDINPDDFQKFLELIHGEPSIDDNTVSGILNLADMYDVPTAIRRCEEFLLKNSQKSMVQKLQLALRCNLESLKTKCLSEITEISDVKSIMAANLPEMDLSTAQALLQKCIDFSDK